MEAKINNTIEQRRIREAKITLVIVGTGIMMFGAWAALKVFSLLVLRPETTVSNVRNTIGYPDSVTDSQILIALFVVAGLYVLLELGVRVLVGLSAIAEGRGKRSGKIYIVLTFILILSALLAVLFDLNGVINDFTGESGTGELSRTDAETSLIIDLTSLIMMIEMVVAAFRVKRYNRMIRRSEADHAA